MEPLTPRSIPPRVLHRRTAVRWAVAALTVVILVGAYLVASMYMHWWPYCSTPAGVAGPGEHCGGNIATARECGPGYHCAPTPGSNLPFGDIGGVCVADETSAGVTYRNEQYGLLVSLPDDWRGFSVLTETKSITDVNSGATVGSFVELKLRNPKWTSANPYEDLPIMVFTPDQWAHVANGEWNVSAAPFPPSELTRNSKFVFGLPPRYNYDFAQGWEQVQQLVDNHAVQAFEP